VVKVMILRVVGRVFFLEADCWVEGFVVGGSRGGKGFLDVAVDEARGDVVVAGLGGVGWGRWVAGLGLRVVVVMCVSVVVVMCVSVVVVMCVSVVVVMCVSVVVVMCVLVVVVMCVLVVVVMCVLVVVVMCVPVVVFVARLIV
jgi:hypothetical protein